VARAAKDAPITAQLVGFVRLLRANGFAPGLAEAQDAVRTAAADDLLRPQLLRYGLRALWGSDYGRFRQSGQHYRGCLLPGGNFAGMVTDYCQSAAHHLRSPRHAPLPTLWGYMA
jgi:hypothetical protein